MTNDLKVLVVGVMALLTVRVSHAQMADTYSHTPRRYPDVPVLSAD